jgi:hypothetical protein
MDSIVPTKHEMRKTGMNVEEQAILMIRRDQQVPVDLMIRIQELGIDFEAFEKKHSSKEVYLSKHTHQEEEEEQVTWL